KRTDAAIKEYSPRMPALQLQADRHRGHVVQKSPGGNGMVASSVDFGLAKQQRLEHVRAYRLKISKRIQAIGFWHHCGLKAMVCQEQRAPIATGNVGGGGIETMNHTVEHKQPVDAHRTAPSRLPENRTFW